MKSYFLVLRLESSLLNFDMYIPLDLSYETYQWRKSSLSSLLVKSSIFAVNLLDCSTLNSMNGL